MAESENRNTGNGLYQSVIYRRAPAKDRWKPLDDPTDDLTAARLYAGYCLRRDGYPGDRAGVRYCRLWNLPVQVVDESGNFTGEISEQCADGGLREYTLQSAASDLALSGVRF